MWVSTDTSLERVRSISYTHRPFPIVPSGGTHRRNPLLPQPNPFASRMNLSRVLSSMSPPEPHISSVVPERRKFALLAFPRFLGLLGSRHTLVLLEQYSTTYRLLVSKTKNR